MDKKKIDTFMSNMAEDVNGEGNVNSIDFGVYRQHLLGIIKEFPSVQK